MTDAAATSQPTTAARPLAFTMIGDPDAAACEGDVCLIPAHPEHGIMNRRLDDDRV
jgi:hypothetical protein